MSFAKLVQRFKSGFEPAETKPSHEPVRLATAAILLDIAYADGDFSPAEDGDIVGFLKRCFELDESSVRDLLKAADELRGQTIDHYALTNFVRRTMSLPDRIEIVKTMWRVVYADGRLTDYENYLVRKLADLLGLEHHVMIDAKVAVIEERGR